jgi:glycosyltransferase involved in cell wall biosynthesis
MSAGVMQMVDSLSLGGTERVGVNLANLLPRDRYRPFLCSTRDEGPLADFVSADVPRLHLARRGKVDLAQVWRTARFAREHGVRIIHAHSSSLFFARLVAMLPPFPRVVWHDHFGRVEYEERSAMLYGLATRNVGAIISVNEKLRRWATERLPVAPDRVWYIPNFVDVPEQRLPQPEGMPGQPGRRILCVANMRAQKDHPTLLAAMQQVIQRVPDAHLILAGAAPETAYRDQVLAQIGERGLSAHVTYLGPRPDAAALMQWSDVGVLSSISEGLPLSLMEYGLSGLACVSTNVGQCGDLLDHGAAGELVPPSRPDLLIRLLTHEALRRDFSGKVKAHLNKTYGRAAILDQVCSVYDSVLAVRS